MFETIKTWTALSASEQVAIVQRPALIANDAVRRETRKIIAAVRDGGDAALIDFAQRFESCSLDSLIVSAAEFQAAERTLKPESKAAIKVAIRNVQRFHATQKPLDIDIDICPGVRCQRQSHAIDAVGLYVPAGTAPLPSTAIMLAIPAAVAGCPTRVLCTPADQYGRVNAATLFAARQSGVQQVFKIGGAQAIAAMAYGTTTVPRVNKIFGPGNTWVTTAKNIVASDPAGVSIDMPAGPSEVLVIADDTANPAYVAADLLSQAEHGEDSQVVLVTTSPVLAAQVIRETEMQLDLLERQAMARVALQHSHIVVTPDIETAIEISNRYAPEHLILQIEAPRTVLENIRNAGSVFLGGYTPESAGDYCSGTNHVLPTYGMARSFSGLGVEQFMRQMTVQEMTEEGLRSLAPTIIELATLEGLDAHAGAVRVRLARDQALGLMK